MTKAIYFAGDKYIKMFSSSNNINLSAIISAIPTSAIVKGGTYIDHFTVIGDQRIALCGIQTIDGVFYYISEDGIMTDAGPSVIFHRWMLRPQDLKDIK